MLLSEKKPSLDLVETCSALSFDLIHYTIHFHNYLVLSKWGVQVNLERICIQLNLLLDYRPKPCRKMMKWWNDENCLYTVSVNKLYSVTLELRSIKYAVRPKWGKLLVRLAEVLSAASWIKKRTCTITAPTVYFISGKFWQFVLFTNFHTDFHNVIPISECANSKAYLITDISLNTHTNTQICFLSWGLMYFVYPQSS